MGPPWIRLVQHIHEMPHESGRFRFWIGSLDSCRGPQAFPLESEAAVDALISLTHLLSSVQKAQGPPAECYTVTRRSLLFTPAVGSFNAAAHLCVYIFFIFHCAVLWPKVISLPAAKNKYRKV